jgi:hypothetical protein
MGTLEVDKLDPQSGTALEIGTSGDTVTVPSGVTLTVAGALNVTGTTALADGTVAIAELDIDGGTDIGAAVVAADLFVVDDGAGGANRKTAASRIKTFVEASTVAVTGNVTATGTIEPAGDTAASDNAAIGYTSAEGLILTGQGSTNDVTVKNDADADVITIATGATNVDVVGDLTAGTLNADGDTAAGDNAAIGYTASEGLILTGQGSTNDVTVKNDADADVIKIPTGTTGVTFAGAVTVTGHLSPAANDTYDLGSGSYIWRDIYTGDLNLTNVQKDEGNDIDGTKGSWKIQEGENDLFIMNKVSGKKYKFKLEEIV